MVASRVVHVTSTDDGVAAQELREGIARIQEDLAVSVDFPAEVAEAAEKAVADPRLPDLDRTDLPFVTIDPPTSQDLDQAMHLVRDGEGYVVYYAIADLAAFITPGDPIDLEANKRGETLYGADSKVPLHPTTISEGAASLLPDQICPALLWTIKVDKTGEGTDVHVERARVRSTAKLDYAGVQRAIDDGSADEALMLLKEVGELRLAREAARGGVSLPLPEQEVSIAGEEWHLEFRAQLPTEQWNAQISLLTGMAAASLMVFARIGLLRTLPPPNPNDVQRLRRTAQALGIDWPADMSYPDFIRSLDPQQPNHAAAVEDGVGRRAVLSVQRGHELGERVVQPRGYGVGHHQVAHAESRDRSLCLGVARLARCGVEHEPAEECDPRASEHAPEQEQHEPSRDQQEAGGASRLGGDARRPGDVPTHAPERGAQDAASVEGQRGEQVEDEQ